jgi:hypothetical protein
MPIANIHFTSDFLVEAFQRYRRQHRGRSVILAIRLLAFPVLALVALALFWQGDIAEGLYFAAFIVFLFFAHHIDSWLIRRTFRKSPYRDDHLTIEFSEAGFHTHSPIQDTKLQWSVFTRVTHFRDGFLLFQGPKAFNWIPVSSLESATQVAELETLLRSRVQEHRIIQPCVVPATK